MNFFLLLYNWFLSFKHRIRVPSRKEAVKPVIFSIIALLFWGGTFIVFYRVLAYFQGIESLGDFLAAKLLAMVLLTFFSILIFSNIITALSTFYLSQDLQLVLSLPISLSEVFFARLIETTINSSWMVLLFGFPVFMAYGIVYQASLSYYALCC